MQKNLTSDISISTNKLVLLMLSSLRINAKQTFTRKMTNFFSLCLCLCRVNSYEDSIRRTSVFILLMFVLIFLSPVKTSNFLHETMYTWRILEETWQAIKKIVKIFCLLDETFWITKSKFTYCLFNKLFLPLIIRYCTACHVAFNNKTFNCWPVYFVASKNDLLLSLEQVM